MLNDRAWGRALVVVLGVCAAVGLGTVIVGWRLLPWTGRGASPGSDSERSGAEGPAWFVEAAAEAGLDFMHVRGPERFWFPEIMCGGACLFDYDNDGDLDLYVVQGGDLDPAGEKKPGNRLYRNRGDGAFEEVTSVAGVAGDDYGMGCVCGDYDADGDVDLYVTNVGPNVLYRNDGESDGPWFTNVTAEAGVGDPSWSASAAFLDYDGDGLPDLFVTNYVRWSIETDIPCYGRPGRRDYCQPATYNAPAPDRLYRNVGGGRFEDVTESAGIHRADGNGLGVACGDFNGDGRQDIYVANDGNPNQLWINDGRGGFADEALLAGCSVNIRGAAEAGMGVAAADPDADGDLDLFMTHLRHETNTFYRNDSSPSTGGADAGRAEGCVFNDITAATGMAAASIPFTGFGMGFADFDHDGRLDVFVANGRIGNWRPNWSEADPYGEPKQLFRGLGDCRFEEVFPRGGTAEPVIGASRGAAFGDIDNDGDVDVVAVESGGPVRLLRNEAARGNWIMFRVLDRLGGDALGAMVEIVANGQRQSRLVHPAYSYCSSNDPRAHFGLGAAVRVDEVRVRWPDGESQGFGPFGANAMYALQRKQPE